MLSDVDITFKRVYKEIRSELTKSGGLALLGLGAKVLGTGTQGSRHQEVKRPKPRGREETNTTFLLLSCCLSLW